MVSNAIKFSLPGGSATISLEQGWADGHTRIIVTDIGIGTREEDIPVALAPLGRTESALNRRYNGTGLGLPLSQKFAQLLGGDLDIASTPGKGTRVTIQLPSRIARQFDRELPRMA